MSRGRGALPSRQSVPAACLLAGIICVGGVLRFATLGTESFWLDEDFTQGIVAHGIGHVLAMIPKTESPPPL